MKYQCACGNTYCVSEQKYKLLLELFCSQCQTMTKWTAIEWPEAEVDKEIWFNGDTIWKCPVTMKCFQCEEKDTEWVSLSFEGHLCSPICCEKAWQAYWGAN